jgi:hypothetical protein
MVARSAQAIPRNLQPQDLFQIREKLSEDFTVHQEIHVLPVLAGFMNLILETGLG